MKDKFEIKNLLGNKQKRTYRREVFRYYRAGFVLCLIIMALVYCAVFGNTQKTSPNALEHTISSPVVKVLADEDKYTKRGYKYCYDEITCVRDVGEELGMSNSDIITMIKIGRCESGLRENAMGVNTNKTVDRGVFQINSIHKNISNQDAFDFEKNIKYAWNMFKAQGTTPWNSSKHCWNK